MAAPWLHWTPMNKNKFGEIVFDENDCIDFVMQGQIDKISSSMLVENVQLNYSILDDNYPIKDYIEHNFSVKEYDQNNQKQWMMPEEYKNFDVAEHVLNMCTTEEQLQRVAEELLLFQEKNLFGLLKYLKYLVDTMQANNIIWGVGRGSSVASYVLFLLGVHKIDSIYYDLTPEEFLR